MVAGLLQHLANGDTLLEILRFVPAVTSMSNLLAVQSRQERGPSRTTDGVVIELREPQSVTGQRVNVRRVDLAAVAADVRPAQIIRHYEDDIGTFGGGLIRSLKRQRAGDDHNSYQRDSDHDVVCLGWCVETHSACLSKTVRTSIETQGVQVGILQVESQLDTAGT